MGYKLTFSYGGIIMSIYAYVRVSSRNQNGERQLIAVRDAGVNDKNIFVDKQSGKNFNRPAYKRLIKKLKPSDILVIKSIDRPGRNYSDIIDQWKIITKDKRVNVKVLDMPVLSQINDDLTGTLIADIVLQLLSYVAQTERDFIRQRQAEGIAAAMARGVHFGRSPKKRPAIFSVLREQWLVGKVSARVAAKELNVAHSTFLRRCRS